MRVLLSILLVVASAVAFAPTTKEIRPTTQLQLKRRDLIATGVLVLTTLPQFANAKGSTFFFDDKIENFREESQMATKGGRLDLNSAPVGDYKVFPGMFPHAAGKIASNGPYASVSDIYKIEGLTANDKNQFKKYENYFTTNPPGRAFKERINARVST